MPFFSCALLCMIDGPNSRSNLCLRQYLGLLQVLGMSLNSITLGNLLQWVKNSTNCQDFTHSPHKENKEKWGILLWSWEICVWSWFQACGASYRLWYGDLILWPRDWRSKGWLGLSTGWCPGASTRSEAWSAPRERRWWRQTLMISSPDIFLTTPSGCNNAVKYLIFMNE